MAMMVHLTDELTAKKIGRGGIKGRQWKLGDQLPGRTRAVFCMPVLQDFYTSHQWLRELKCRRTKKMVGVYFRIPDDELAQFGYFNQQQELLPVHLAIKKLIALPDPMGYEMILLRSVTRVEVHKIRALPQTIGWRYMPDARADSSTITQHVQSALMKISPSYREVVILRDVQQLSYEEIAEVTQLEIGTVKSRINRGRAQLQLLLKPLYNEMFA